jgi:PTH1 family peptidyl-tRNA hydrolase
VAPILVVGLGNPGSEYEQTRHNIGFLVVDILCERFRWPLRAGRGDYLQAMGNSGPAKLLLMKPMTYMNNSGQAVKEVVESLGLPLSGTLVVYDDIALPLGTLRVRSKGSDGGHNGVYSIIYHLNSNGFPRIRCGIRQEAAPRKHEMAGFVLSRFDREEKPRVTAMTERAADAVLAFAASGIARTMNTFNT